jgi:hypothetical protein
VAEVLVRARAAGKREARSRAPQGGVF